MLLDANVIVNRLITGLIVLRNNVERIYRYLNVIASQEVNPVMIPPPPLRQLLAEVQEEMKSNPRLMLPYDHNLCVCVRLLRRMYLSMYWGSFTHLQLMRGWNR